VAVSTIFFSWQSDTPAKTGRNFIERALEAAIGQVKADLEVEEAAREIEVDRDTKGVPGSPRIVDTIFAKIDAAEAFIGDVTFIGTRPNGDPIPNPNVLIEYGWALNSRTHDRVLTVLNTVYGQPTSANLPFDMRHVRHPIEYHLADDASPDEVKAERTALAKTFATAIRDILKIEKVPPAPPPLFVARTPGASPGRFRAEGEPLAHSYEHFFMGSTYQVTLAPGPVSWLRLTPKLDPGRRWTFSELKAQGGERGHLLRPYGMGGGDNSIGWLRDVDGFGTRVMLPDDKETALWATFVFDTGEVWGVDAFIMGATKDYIALDHGELAASLKNFRELLERLGLEGPYRWMAGLEGVKGRSLAISPQRSTFGPKGTALVDIIEAEGELLANQDPVAAIWPFVVKAYDQCGLTPPPAP
jgi:hypothetical protein